MKFVIIGGDAAGMSAASRGKRNLPNWEVIVLEQTRDVSYSACGMPYNIGDSTREIDDLVVRQAHVFRDKQGIDLKTEHSVETIDRKEKTVRGKTSQGQDFAIPYDKLLIATGASATRPDIPGLDLHGVMTLKRLNDGRKIKDFLLSRNVEKVVIIGMGYIALEMCEALCARDMDVNMVKPRPVFLPWMNPTLSQAVQNEVKHHDVGIHLGYKIKSIEAVGKNSLQVNCEGMALECQMVLVATGVTPNSGIAANAGLELGPKGAVAVDKTLRTSDKDIYAAGDCADAFHVVTEKRTWIPLALRANRAGWAVADNLSGKEISLQGVAGTAVFKVFDLQVARTGLSLAEAKDAGFSPIEVVVEARSRAHAHPGAVPILVQMVGDQKSGRLLGMQLVGAEGVAHRIDAAAVALHQRMSVEAFGQCDLAYAPPFGPVWDPMLVAANQFLKKISAYGIRSRGIMRSSKNSLHFLRP